jgi:hypothetical protein
VGGSAREFGSEIFGAKNPFLGNKLSPNHNRGVLQHLFTKEEKTDKPFLGNKLSPNQNRGVLQHLFTKEEKTDKPYLCEGLGVWNVVKNF